MVRWQGSNLFGSANDRVAESNRRMLEQQNDEKHDVLADQVRRLKEMTIEIGEEVDEQNRILDGMGGQITGVSGMLHGTLGKLGTMLQSGGNQHMLYLIGFVVFSFMIIYYMMTHKGQTAK